MENEPGPSHQTQTTKSPAIPLVLAFLPSVLFLTLLTVSAAFKWNNPPASLLIAGCIIGIIGCLTSSYMLFRRGTALAIFGGIVFLLLNGVVSFLFGCGAILAN